MNAIWYLGQIVLFLVALSTAWWIHYETDFFYRVWYQPLGIKENIDRYGPQNRFKHFFADTQRQDHLRMFHSINVAVHNRGHGLADIHYITGEGYADTLLHDAEIIHLQDVARLIEGLKIVAATAVMVTVLLIGWLRWRAQRLPSLRRTWLVCLVSVCVLLTTVLVLGPTRVFYRFHDWLFPEGHQWFFYYQDSLMSTLMKAPDLFGAIGASLLAMAIVIYMMLSWSLLRWLKRDSR